MSALSRPFQDLGVVGAWGGLAGDEILPEQSSMRLVMDAQPVGQSELLWAFEVHNVHPGVLLIIENLAHRLHTSTLRVAALRLYGNITGRTSHNNLKLPTYYEPVPFELEYNVETAQALVDVSFEDTPDILRLEPFREAWAAWVGVAMEGGFADDTYPPGSSSLAVEDELQIVSTGFGANLDDLSIADAGFYCLVNMLHKLHRVVVPLSSVVIE